MRPSDRAPLGTNIVPNPLGLKPVAQVHGRANIVGHRQVGIQFPGALSVKSKVLACLVFLGQRVDHLVGGFVCIIGAAGVCA